MTVLIKIIQVLFALSLLVLVHESGHFLFAKLFKIRVEKFYMFFNPWFSLFRMKKLGGKWRFKFFSANVQSNMVECLDENGEPVLNKKGKPVFRLMTEEEIAGVDALLDRMVLPVYGQRPQRKCRA